MDAARSALRLGAETVYIIYRRGFEELPARKEEIEHAMEEGIIFKFLTNPIEIIGDDTGSVQKIKCIEMELGEPDASGRRKPIEKPNSEFEIDVDCVIMSLGTTPNPLIKSTIDGLDTEKWGGIIIKENGETSVDGVFAGGDAVTGAATVILAMGAGKVAANGIDQYIMNKNRMAEFYKGEPIWNTVERQGGVAHVYGWVGVDAAINGRKPTVAITYDSRRTRTQLANLVLGALCNSNVEQIPNLTMWYFDEPDAIEHRYSPNSEETRKVVEEIDDVLTYFMREVRKSPVFDKINFIFTADHGMTELNPDKYYNIYSLIPDRIRYYYNSNPVTLEPKNLAETKEIYSILKAHEKEGHYRVWLREDMPEEYHYGTYTDRIYPIVLLADVGWKVVYNESPNAGRPSPKASSHGFDPFHPDMHMVFYGCGPAFKKGYVHDRVFQNLNDHMIITHILGMDAAEGNDCVWEDIKGLFAE